MLEQSSRPERAMPIVLDEIDGRLVIATETFRLKILRRVQDAGVQDNTSVVHAPERTSFALYPPGKTTPVFAARLKVRVEAQNLFVLEATDATGNDVLAKKPDGTKETDPSMPAAGTTMPELDVQKLLRRDREANLRGMFYAGVASGNAAAAKVLKQLLPSLPGYDSNVSFDRQLGLLSGSPDRPLFLETIARLLQMKNVNQKGGEFLVSLRAFLEESKSGAGAAAQWITVMLTNTEPATTEDSEAVAAKPVGVESGKALLTWNQILAKLEQKSSAAVQKGLELVNERSRLATPTKVAGISSGDIQALEQISKLLTAAALPHSRRGKDTPAAAMRLHQELYDTPRSQHSQFDGLSQRLNTFLDKAKIAESQKKKE